MADFGRFGGEILHREPVDDVAELDHRVEHALLEDEIEYAEDEERGQRQHDLRDVFPALRNFGRALDLGFDATVEPVLKALDLQLGAIELPLIFGAEQYLAGERGIALFLRGQRRLLFVVQRVGERDGLLQRIEFACAGARVADMADAIFHRFERRDLAAIGGEVGRVAGVDELAGPVAERINLGPEFGGGLVERIALFDRCPLMLLRVRGEDHHRARHDRQDDRGAIGPVGDCRQTHDRVLDSQSLERG